MLSHSHPNNYRANIGISVVSRHHPTKYRAKRTVTNYRTVTLMRYRDHLKFDATPHPDGLGVRLRKTDYLKKKFFTQLRMYYFIIYRGISRILYFSFFPEYYFTANVFLRLLVLVYFLETNLFFFLIFCTFCWSGQTPRALDTNTKTQKHARPRASSHERSRSCW